MNETHLTERFVEALAFATRAHRGQYRKGTGIPYVSHPLQVAGIALEHGADEDQAIAALLHDVIEDTDVTEAELAQRFGGDVARIVADCSDAEGPDEKPPWRKRKESYLAHLATSSGRSALVSCADKLHNARSVVSDLERYGPATLDRFNGKRRGTLWYYRQLAKLFGRLDVPKGLRDELAQTVRHMGHLLSDASP